MRLVPSNGSPTQNGKSKCGTRNQGEDDLIKNSNFSNYPFAKRAQVVFMVCIGGSNLFWNMSMRGQILVLRGKDGGLHVILIII